MFGFVTRYLGFLKLIPTLSWAFDGWLKVWALVTKPYILDWMDDIEAEVLEWEGTAAKIHKYGGLQFNCGRKEIGHIHSNGLLDMLLSRAIKQKLMEEGRIADHHSFKNTGWISFYIRNADDKEYALKLLKFGHERIKNGKR